MRYPNSEDREVLASLPASEPTASYWLKDLSKELRGHRTTSVLPRIADVVVVGSGLVGSMAAWELMGMNNSEKQPSDPSEGLSRRGTLNVVMLEAREACSGATGRNGGHCSPQLVGQYPDIAAFEFRNWNFLKSLVDQYNIPCDWETVPLCHSFMNPDDFKNAVSNVLQLKAMDPDLAKHLSVITPESISPSLADYRINPAAAGAVIMDTVANLWPYKLVAFVLEKMLAEKSAAKDVSERSSSGSFNLQTNTPATSLQRLSDGTWVVHTPRGMIAAGNVILATNAYTSYLLSNFSDLIVPVQGQMSALVPPSSLKPQSNPRMTLAGELQASYGFTSAGKDGVSQSDYLMQRPFKGKSVKEGELMYGGGRTFAHKSGLGVSDDSRIDEDVAAYLRRGLYPLLDIKSPGSAESPELIARYEWTGIMGYSRDAHPWVGRVPGEENDGLWISAGFTGHGMVNAPLCGRAVAQLMLTDGLANVDLPLDYHISSKRALAALSRPAVQDWHGVDDDGTARCWDFGSTF